MVEKFKFILLEILLLWPCVSKSFLLGILTRCIYFCKHVTIFIYSNKWYPWKGNSPSNNAVLVDRHCILPFVNVDTCITAWSQKFLKLSFFHCPDQYFLNNTKEKKEKICSSYHITCEWGKLFLFVMKDVVAWWVWSFLTIQNNIVAINRWITSEV